MVPQSRRETLAVVLVSFLFIAALVTRSWTGDSLVDLRLPSSAFEASSTLPDARRLTATDALTDALQAQRRRRRTRRLQGSEVALLESPTNFTRVELDASSHWMCRNTCYKSFGFHDSDCRCDRHDTWFMWVCTHYQGEPIEVQYCGMQNCGGCHAVRSGGAPAAPQVPNSSSSVPNSSSSNSSSSAPQYNVQNPLLLLPSNASLMNFYMYRVQSDYNYPPENQNMASLGGALWYLHNEIVNNKGARRFAKTRIQRFRMAVRATQPLLDIGLHFGPRYAFDMGQCTGPWDSAEAFARFGYFVGCNYVDRFPTKQWKGQVFYRDAMWYSLPGKCSSKLYNQHTEECDIEYPGGACSLDHGGNVTGQGNCTYAYEDAGEITIDELENITSFQAFANAGGWEYNNKTDRGVHMSFWDNKSNHSACDARLQRASELFAQKYPDSPTDEQLPPPACDMDEQTFYRYVPQMP